MVESVTYFLVVLVRDFAAPVFAVLAALVLVFAFVDFAAVVFLAVPVFALVDLAAIVADLVVGFFAVVDFAAVVFLVVFAVAVLALVDFVAAAFVVDLAVLAFVALAGVILAVRVLAFGDFAAIAFVVVALAVLALAVVGFRAVVLAALVFALVDLVAVLFVAVDLALLGFAAVAFAVFVDRVAISVGSCDGYRGSLWTISHWHPLRRIVSNQLQTLPKHLPRRDTPGVDIWRNVDHSGRPLTLNPLAQLIWALDNMVKQKSLLCNVLLFLEST